MRTGSGLFLSGILTLVQFRQLPPAVVMVIAVLIIFLIGRMTGRLKALLWYGGGLLWAYVAAVTLLAQDPAGGREGRTLRVHGQVVSLPEISDQSVQFDFDIIRMTDLRGDKQDYPGKVRLNWYRPFPALRAGQFLNLEIRLKKPHGYHNPDGFDYEGWLFQQHIRATGYVRRMLAEEEQRQTEITVHSLRQGIRETLESVIRLHTSTGTLVAALTIGDQSMISKAQWRTLAMTGTGHLLSISGLHIGLLALMGYFITRWLWPLYPAAANRIPAPTIAAAVSLILAVLYSLMAGFTVPVQRSLIMIATFTLPTLLNRKMAAANCFASALLLVLVLDPMAVLSTSFWLSFGSVLILLLIPATVRSERTSFLIRWLRLQLFVFTGLILIVAVWFNQLAISGLLANLFAIPWVSFITVPLLLGGTTLLYVSPDIGKPLLDAGSYTLDLLWPILQWLESLDTLFLFLAEPDAVTVLISCAGILLLMLPAGMPVRWAGPVCLLPLLLAGQQMPKVGELEATVLDVGQGLAVLVRTHTHVLLYDTGPGFPGGFTAGWAVIVPYLRSLGIARIDTVVISHGDNDHLGGLADVLNNVPVRQIITSVPQKIMHANVHGCLAGQDWEWEGVQFSMLAPVPGSQLHGNNGSCVLQLRNAGGSILLPGDIEREAELELILSVRQKTESTVLIAPHHGSRTSSSPAFLNQVNAQYVIISAGYLNRFRLPNQDIINRYTALGMVTMNTAETGAVRIRSGHEGLQLIMERNVRSRFWNFMATGEKK